MSQETFGRPGPLQFAEPDQNINSNTTQLSGIGPVDAKVAKNMVVPVEALTSYYNLAKTVTQQEIAEPLYFTGADEDEITDIACDGFMNMDARLIHSILRGDVPYEYARQDSQIKVILDSNMARQVTPTDNSLIQPVIYGRYLKDRNGRGLTREQLRRMITTIRNYFDPNASKQGIAAIDASIRVGQSKNRPAYSPAMTSFRLFCAKLEERLA